MYNFKAINVELENLQGLKTLAEVYQEVAAIYIQKNKELILESRNFYDGLSEIFNEIIFAYKRAEQSALQKRSGKKKKRALVLMSANAGLYGEIVERVFQKFAKDAMQPNPPHDLIVIGKYGKAMIDASAISENYAYFDFPDTKLNFSVLKPIIELLNVYEEVSVYYGSFKNLVDQVPAVKNIREAAKEATPSSKTGRHQKPRYIFEPSLEQLYQFFEAEIFASIIEQLSYEFTLSKLSSRTLLLDSVIGNIEKKVRRAMLVQQKKIHEAVNKKQADSTAGILQATNGSY